MSDPIFQKGLQDLIKGIRANKRDLSPYISQSIAEIKQELRSTDSFIKAEAVRKLTYLQMLGYNVSWAAFAIVEVMSQPRFGHKRIGYLAANQTFDESTDVILLTTNLFKKEFSSGLNSQYEIGMAINCLANIATKDLAQDCMPDLVIQMNNNSPYIRKKAVLAMYKLYVKFPQGLRLTFDKLKDRLDDGESSVVSTAVNVICELANKNPKNYLAMAPKFFKLLTTSSNNWMLIKIVKLLGSLVSEEPRLARKLLEPLSTIIQNTGAKSLQYECIYTVTEALPYSKREDGSDAKNAAAVIDLCSQQLRKFIEDSDQNLKYLGLLGLVRLMKSNPRTVIDHRDLVLKCLDDEDVTIRTRSLELLAGIVSKKSLIDLVHHLLEHANRAEGSYKDEVISKILYMCRKEKYSLVTDFAWYTSILLKLAIVQGTKHGHEVADQLIEICLRVDSVRPYAVESMLSMLLNDNLILGQARTTVSEVLKAAAWIVGEYSDIVTNIANDDEDSGDEDDEDDENGYWIEGATGEEIRSIWRGSNVHLLVMEALLHPRATNLPAHVQMVYVHASLKIFVRACKDCELPVMTEIVGVLRKRLSIFLQSLNLEVQERASTLRHLLAEFDVLPLNWEELLEEIINGDESEKKKEKKNVDLLEFPTSNKTKEIDEIGAKNALQKNTIICASMNEKFYAVHSKAQKKVPLPEGLDLEVSYNSTALNNLLSMVIPDNLSLNNLTFVPQNITNLNNNDSYASESKLYKLLDNSIPNSNTDVPVPASNFPVAIPNNSSSYNYNSTASRSTADDIFMLGSNNKTKENIIPLVKILGDNFEDIPNNSHHSRKNKKGKKSKSKKVDMSEMLPAGAMSSDDDNDAREFKNDSKTKKKGKSEIGLDNVDLLTPLQAGEKLEVKTHRVVPMIPPVGAQEETIDDQQNNSNHKKDKKKKKKNKDHDLLLDETKETNNNNNKSEKSKSKKSKSASRVEIPLDNLLGLDWSTSNTNPMSDMLFSNNINNNNNNNNNISNMFHDDLLSLSASTPMMHGMTSDNYAADSSNNNIDNNNSSSKKKKSSLSSCYWHVLYEDVNLDILYSTIVSTNNNNNKLQILLKMMNHTPDNSNLSVDMMILSQVNSSIMRINDALIQKTVRIGANILPMSDVVYDFIADIALPNHNLTLLSSQQERIYCNFTIHTESLLGSDIMTLSNQCLSFHSISDYSYPFKTDQEHLMSLLSKHPSAWYSSQTNLSSYDKKKLKSVFKNITNYCHGHVIESMLEGSNKSMIISLKTIANDIVFVFLKSSTHDISIELKAISSTKNYNDAQMITLNLIDGLVNEFND
eukprot:gene13128-17595_t